MGDESLRVSDAEREQTVISLREHLLAGRLTLDEFSERVGAALGARVGSELARAHDGLPTIPGEATRPRRRPARFTAAVLGHVARRGALRLRGWTVAASAFGDVDLDLRDAVIDQPRTTVTVLAACGNVDVYVPEGVDVDVSGITVFGHRRDWGNDVSAPDAPAVHVRVLGCLGTVDVWRVPHGTKGTYSDIMRQLEARHPELPA